jgi:ribosomal protein S18 acetylase RimI-like enzyme
VNPPNDVQTDHILSILNQDRIWCAYALVDLDPEHSAFSEWHVLGNSVLLCYTGLEPPILFAHGEVEQLRSLLEKFPSGGYQISFPYDLLQSLPASASILNLFPMWRMRFDHSQIAQRTGIEVERLGVDDLAHIDRLYKGQQDAPDGYHSRQLEMGPFVGIWESGTLVATAGIHVFSERRSMAAIGNVYTHPDWRRRGLAQACTASLLSILLSKGVATIVLNVGQNNQAALALYERMGFKIHCPFYEGNILI